MAVLEHVRAGGVRRCTRSAVAGLALLLVSAPASAFQRGPVQLDIGARAGASYDTNLEHRPEGTQTVGASVAGDVRLRLRAGPIVATLQQGISSYRYERLPQRNRTGYDTRLTIDLAAAQTVTLRTAAVVSIGGLSEDREVGRSYGITENLDLQLGNRNRMRISAGYAERRYGERSGRDADNWSVGIGWTIGSRTQPGLSLQTRYDENETSESRSAFRRWTHRVGFQAPLGATRLNLNVRRVAREYPNRLVELEEVRDLALGSAELELIEAYERDTGTPRGAIPAGELLQLLSDRWRNLPRRDEIWAPSARLTINPGGRLEVDLAYEFETRLSSDLRRGYSGHTLELSTRVSR